MSRKIMRVPLTFDAPLDTTWGGYLTPDRLREDDCPDCHRGYTPAGEWLQTIAHRLGMLAEDVADQNRGRALHPWLADDVYPPIGRGHQAIRPSEDIVDLVAGLADEDRSRLLRPACSADADRIAAKIVEAAGLDPDVWGVCRTCGGRATLESYPGQRAEAEAWESTEPPEGEGWQLWQTVSEGAPISPVFATAEALAAWMASPAYTWGAVGDGRQPSYDTALRFIREGWAPTTVSSDATGPVDGVEWVGRTAGKEA